MITPTLTTTVAPYSTPSSATEPRRIVYVPTATLGSSALRVVPEESPRRMPEQPLGEFHPSANPQVWLSVLRTSTVAVLAWTARLPLVVLGSAKSD